MSTAATSMIDWSDVQGMVLRGYGAYPYSTNMLLRVDDQAVARVWLSSLCARITTADRSLPSTLAYYCNVAFTRAGLKNLGLPAEVLSTFPTAFYEGPATPNRSRILGDADNSTPQNWDWGMPGEDVDGILMIFAMQQADLDAAMQAEQTKLRGVSLKFPPIVTQLSSDRKEHFGFRDGISQPVIIGSPPPRKTVNTPINPVYGDANRIAAGEFLLGYLNEYGVLPDAPDMPAGTDPHGLLSTLKTPGSALLPDLGRNGTFLVVRQIEQHVANLWKYLDKASQDQHGQSRPAERDKFGAKLIGRWRGGAPVNTTYDDPALSRFNDFLYKGDADGVGCPFGAHVRRGNPRDTLGLSANDKSTNALNLTKRHRLIRRGRSYGFPIADPLVDDQQKRGLLFMCINTNIERQFEFVQQTWINNPSFNGLYDERDPVFGNTSSQTNGTMTIPANPVRRQLTGLGGFVTVRGAAYFFMPSIRALRYLGAQ